MVLGSVRADGHYGGRGVWRSRQDADQQPDEPSLLVECPDDGWVYAPALSAFASGELRGCGRDNPQAVARNGGQLPGQDRVECLSRSDRGVTERFYLGQQFGGGQPGDAAGKRLAANPRQKIS